MDHVLASAVLVTFVLRMRTTGHACTSGLNIDFQIKFSVSDIVQNQNFCQFGHVLEWTVFGHY